MAETHLDGRRVLHSIPPVHLVHHGSVVHHPVPRPRLDTGCCHLDGNSARGAIHCEIVARQREPTKQHKGRGKQAGKAGRSELKRWERRRITTGDKGPFVGGDLSNDGRKGKESKAGKTKTNPKGEITMTRQTEGLAPLRSERVNKAERPLKLATSGMSNIARKSGEQKKEVALWSA